MNELQVIANQTPGTIKWNFEELKERLTADMKRYESIVYTDDNIKEAKSDIAGLRKLQKEVNDRKIEIKKVCLAPYELFEEQVNELKAIIEKPIAMIDEKVKDYEARRRKAVMQKIRAYFDEGAASLPESVRERSFQKIYQDKWLNATTKVSEWKSGVDAGIESIVRDFETLRSMPNDFVNEGVAKYEETLALNEAIQYMNALQRQKQIAEERVEQERRQREERERIAREQAERERLERERAELEKAASAPTQESVAEQIDQNAQKGSNPQENAVHEENIRVEPEKAAPSQNEAGKGILIRLFSEKDVEQVVRYCDFNEIKCEVVR